MSTKTLDISALDNDALEALLAQAKMVQENRKDGNKAEYAESITDFVTKVVANEKFEPNKKGKARVGASVYGMSVIIDGRAFTVSAHVTDTEATKSLQEERDVAAAEALLAKRAEKKDA